MAEHLQNSSCEDNLVVGPSPEWLTSGGFFPVILGIIAIFGGYEFICEEFCVPAITVFCKRNHISDDVAGAIFIGTGLSLPVMFSSFTGLFISKTAIGVGTVVGGDAFNHLINIGLSIYVAPNKTLKLDPVIMTRETVFYLLSCSLIIWATQKEGDLGHMFAETFSAAKWKSCLSITWQSSVVLVANYILYCLVEWYFSRGVEIFHKYTRKPTSPRGNLLNIHSHTMTGNISSAVVMEDVSVSADSGELGDGSGSEGSGPSSSPDASPSTANRSSALAVSTAISASSSTNRRRSNPPPMKSIQLSGDKKRSVVQYRNVSCTGPDDDGEEDEEGAREGGHTSRRASKMKDDIEAGGDDGDGAVNAEMVHVGVVTSRRPSAVESLPQQGQEHHSDSRSNGRQYYNNLNQRNDEDEDEDADAGTVNGRTSTVVAEYATAIAKSSAHNGNIGGGTLNSSSDLGTYKQQQREYLQEHYLSSGGGCDGGGDIELGHQCQQRAQFCLKTDHSGNSSTIQEFDGSSADLSNGSGFETAVDLTDFTMQLKSTFYTMNDFGCIPNSRKWKIRYFTLTDRGLHYRLESQLPVTGPHVRFIDIFDLETIDVVDRNLFEFTLRLRVGNKKYAFRAVDRATFDTVLSKLTAFTEEWKERTEGERVAMSLKAMYEVSNGYDAALVSPDSECVEADDLFAVPTNIFAKVFFLLVFPIKYLIYLTVPDVRKPGYETRALVAISICVVWLAILSYVLVVSLSLIGDWLGVRGRIMGLTVGAWAASYPALWSSIVVARNGYGDVASCNALGSNTFNNYIGLGLPWITYNIVYGGRPYDSIQDDGVVASIMLLMIIMAGHSKHGWSQ